MVMLTSTRSGLVACVMTALLSACGGSDSANTSATTPEDGAGDGSGAGIQTASILDPSHFRRAISVSTVDCTLDNGAQSTCHQLVFKVNQISDGSAQQALIDDELGPFCPTNYTSSDGGLGIYDGTTNPGFQNLNKGLWDSMLADGYQIIDTNNLVCTQDPGSNTTLQGDATCASYCLNAGADDNLIVTYLIPVTPQDLSSPDDIGTIESVGVSLDGVPITGDPPSVVSGPPGMSSPPPGMAARAAIPALDRCGGHHDPAGYYHWHFIPESIDAVHAEFGTNDQASCEAVAQASARLSGYARDGYPIYAYQDMVNGALSTPDDLDACNGHVGVTAEFPNGVYHYHASVDAPNLPPCIKGAAANGSPSVQ